jgi:hypothetical protein
MQEFLTCRTLQTQTIVSFSRCPLAVAYWESNGMKSIFSKVRILTSIVVQLRNFSTHKEGGSVSGFQGHPGVHVIFSTPWAVYWDILSI